jgi:hypothetical protein
MEPVLNRLFCFDSQTAVRVLFIALSVFSVPILSLLHYAYAHSTVDSKAILKTIDNKYKIAFQLYPKFASAGQNATLHFSILDEKGSNFIGVYAALVMKEKKAGTIVEQMPYRFYESSDISIPYKFHDNSKYVATLLTRIGGASFHGGTFHISASRWHYICLQEEEVRAAFIVLRLHRGYYCFCSSVNFVPGR